MRLWLIAFGLCITLASPASAAPTLIYAAASTADVLQKIATIFTHQTGAVIIPIFAGSGTLARQIAEGAPAGLILSADQRWMNWLAERDLIDPASRTDLLANRLVLIAPADAPLTFSIEADQDLATALGPGRLAIADPNAAPAGLYAREALQYLGLWDGVQDRLVPGASVRTVLAWVARGEVRAGIVYQSDARLTNKVMRAALMPEASHAPIRYPLALTPTASQTAHDFHTFLRGKTAAIIFADHGFQVLDGMP